MATATDYTIVLAVSAVAAALGTALTHSRKKDEVRKSRPIHRLPSSLPLVADLFERLQHGDCILDWVTDHSNAFHGEPWMFKIPSQPDVIIVTDPETIHEICQRVDDFPKGAFLREFMNDMFGAGLVTSDGARWAHQRKAANKFFSAKLMRTLMATSLQKNLALVYDVIDTKMSGPAQCVDLKKLFHEFTIQTFGDVGVGVNLDCIGSDEPHPFQAALDRVAPIMSRRFKLAGCVWKAERRLNIGPEAVVTTQMRIVRAWLHDVIRRGLEKSTSTTQQANTDDMKSVIELFLEHVKDSDGDAMQPNDLVDFILTFMIAARDTTASTTCWFFYALSQHPEVEQKLRYAQGTRR